MPWTMLIKRTLSVALLAFPAALFATEPLHIGDVHLHAIPPAAFAQANEAALLRETIDTVGSDRILFGSDQMAWPQMITPAVEAVRDAKFLTESDKRRILWENAAALLKLQ